MLIRQNHYAKQKDGGRRGYAARDTYLRPDKASQFVRFVSCQTVTCQGDSYGHMRDYEPVRAPHGRHAFLARSSLLTYDLMVYIRRCRKIGDVHRIITTLHVKQAIASLFPTLRNLQKTVQRKRQLYKRTHDSNML